MANINIREEMTRAEGRIDCGFYKRDGFRKADAMHRRNFLEDFLDSLDDMIEHNNSMDQVTRNNYNDLRGMILNLLIDENANVRIGVRERRIY